MKPGRQLDTLVAEKVFGKKVIETDDCNGEDNLWLNETSQYGDQLELPHYSTDTAAAWEIAKALTANGFEVSTKAGLNSVQVSFSKADQTFTAHSDNIGTLAHAICLATLKAVGSEK